MSTVGKDQLIAGLWRNHLLEDLCWFRADEGVVSYKQTKWRAPTWSWASINGTVWASLTYGNHRHCPGWRLHSKIDSIDVKSRPSGELEHASLRIRCRPISGIMRVDKDIRRYVEVRGTFNFINSEVQMHATFDEKSPRLAVDIDDPPWEELRSLSLVVIQECRHEANFDGCDTKIPEDQNDKSPKFEPTSTVEGLLLVLQSGYQDVYQRVGFFNVLGVESVTEILREHEAAENAVITLI